MNDPKEIKVDVEIKNDIPFSGLTESESMPAETGDNPEAEAESEEDCYEDDNGSDDYGGSGEKYGWYNGFSDDAIDDAFDGDPEATWNVD